MDLTVLTEEDVPGAKLPRPAPEECNIVQLKRWLLCRGAKTTGRKAELIERMKTYIDNGLSMNIIDPDGGVHERKKTMTARGEMPKDPVDNNIVDWPDTASSESWTADMRKTPHIDYGHIWTFLIDEQERKLVSTTKPLRKGFNFFKSGHVVSIESLQTEQNCFVRSKVLPSMIKAKPYDCKIMITCRSNPDDNCVSSARCACKAGVEGCCNHIAATLFAMEDYSRRCRLSPDSDERTCTSKPCKWTLPSRKRRVDPIPITEADFVKHEIHKSKIPRPSAIPASKDVRAPHHRGVQSTYSLQIIRQELMKIAEEENINIGVLQILPKPAAVDVDHSYTLSSRDDKIPDSIVARLQRFAKGATEDDFDTTSSGFDDIYTSLMQDVIFSDVDIEQIELRTRGQSTNSEWFEQRKGLVTASVFHDICNPGRRETTQPDCLVKKIMQLDCYKPKPLSQSDPRSIGIQTESAALKEYVLLMNSTDDHKGLFVISKGLQIAKSPLPPFIGASVDGEVHYSDRNEVGLVEVKCFLNGSPFSQSHLEVANFPLTRSDEGAYELKKTHKHYYQIQSQMGITNRPWIDYVGFTPLSDENHDIVVVRVPFDNVFFSEMVDKVRVFYKFVLAEVITGRLERGLPLLPRDD